MADGGPPTPPVPQAPSAPQPPPIVPPLPPAQPISIQPMQAAHVPQLNWSHFKPEIADKPDEDAEVHLLRMNDWMGTHAFQEGVKSPTFLSNISRRSKIMV